MRDTAGDICWLLTIETNYSVKNDDCGVAQDNGACAKSRLEFFVFQTLDKTTMPTADCSYIPVGLLPNESMPSSAVRRPAGDLETAFDVQNDTLCGGNPYAPDDGYRFEYDL